MRGSGFESRADAVVVQCKNGAKWVDKIGTNYIATQLRTLLLFLSILTQSGFVILFFVNSLWDFLHFVAQSIIVYFDIIRKDSTKRIESIVKINLQYFLSTRRSELIVQTSCFPKVYNNHLFFYFYFLFFTKSSWGNLKIFFSRKNHRLQPFQGPGGRTRMVE